MNEKNEFALAKKLPNAVEKAAPRAKRILSGMVTDTLALRNKSPVRIVLVDDEDWLLDMVEMATLQKFKGVTVQKFQDSNEASLELQRADPHLLITDDKMSHKPGLNGQDLVRRLVERNVMYPIIVVSGWPPTEQWVREYAINKTNISFLRKPFTTEQLYDELLKHLQLELKLGLPETHTNNEDAEAVYQRVRTDRALKKFADARRSLRKAAEMGHTLAMYECWMDYMDIGDTYPQDKQKAIRERAFHWLRKAAEQGHGMAQGLTAIYYASSNSIFPQNLPEAYKWAKLAAEQDDKCGIKFSTHLSSIMSSEQVQEGERRYREFNLSNK